MDDSNIDGSHHPFRLCSQRHGQLRHIQLPAVHGAEALHRKTQTLELTSRFFRLKGNPHPNLVGGWATPLKNMKVNWDDYSQYMGK